MVPFDFFLDFEDVREQFRDFTDFVIKCELVDDECSVDYDTESVTFYDYSEDFDVSSRALFIKDTLAKSGKDYQKIWRNQIAAQKEWRRVMSLF